MFETLKNINNRFVTEASFSSALSFIPDKLSSLEMDIGTQNGELRELKKTTDRRGRTKGRMDDDLQIY